MLYYVVVPLAQSLIIDVRLYKFELSETLARLRGTELLIHYIIKRLSETQSER